MLASHGSGDLNLGCSILSVLHSSYAAESSESILRASTTHREMGFGLGNNQLMAIEEMTQEGEISPSVPLSLFHSFI